LPMPFALPIIPGPFPIVSSTKDEVISPTKEDATCSTKPYNFL
jgi:hypothetical protein